MKILIVSRRGPTNGDRKGGAQEYILNLAEQLIKRGHELLILCGGEVLNGHRLPLNEQIANVKITRLESAKAGDLLKRVLEIYANYDAVIENIMAFALNIPLHLPGGYPFFVIRHHLQKRNFLKLQGKIKGTIGIFLESIVEPFVYRNTTFIAASDLTRKEIVQRWKKPANTFVVNPGFTYISYEDLPKTDKPSIFFVGHLNTARKKVDDLVRAFKYTLKSVPDCTLFIGGEGPDKVSLENLAAGLPVVFLGFLTEEEKHYWYKQSWLFASPSTSEGFGITWVEANAHGTPVVGYELGLDTVNDTCATMVEIGNVKALSQAMTKLLKDPIALKSKGEAGIINAKKFSWENTARQIEGIIIQKIETTL